MEDFSKLFEEEFKDFQKSVPGSDVTRLDGFMNVAAHNPLNGIVPDLGKVL